MDTCNAANARALALFSRVTQRYLLLWPVRRNHKIDPRPVGTSQDRTQVVRILHPVEDQDKRAFTPRQDLTKIPFRRSPVAAPLRGMRVGSSSGSGLLPWHQVNSRLPSASILSDR